MMTATESAPAVFSDQVGRWKRRTVMATAILLGLGIFSVVVALGFGAVTIAPARLIEILIAAFFNPDLLTQDRDALVIINIRTPRIALGLEVGGALALSGALMQGLFRNPLADPALIGVSSGASLAAAATIVLADHLLPNFAPPTFFPLLPLSAFGGGLCATIAVYMIATREGRTAMTTMLLAGVVLGALASAGVSFLAFLSNDRQLRDLTFWSLGSLNGATWSKVAAITPLVGLLFLTAPLLGRGLNALAFGEAEAFYLGLRVQLVKTVAIGLIALAVGAAVASAGVIGFVGVTAPHIVRLAVGSDHRILLPLTALCGAELLICADTLARTIVAPAELPLGVLTAAVGAPFFLWLLLRHQRSFHS